jgi:sugar lactone lactonase YvrE
MQLALKSVHAGRVRRWATTMTLVGVLSFAATGTASAATAASGYTVSNFATGFHNIPARGLGPTGVAFGPSGTLFVSDVPDGHVYEFGSAGGVADASTMINPSSPFPRDDIRGLAFGQNGELFLAQALGNKVVQIDPGDGHVVRTVTTTIQCPVGLAVQPGTGDLFVTSPKCSTAVWRISAPGSANPTVAPFATNLQSVDGIAFAPNGDMWLASMGGSILRIPVGTSTPAVVANVPLADGLAIQAGPGGAAAAVFVNSNDGNITRVDATNGSTTPVMSGGSRGDFMIAGPDGALYATQTDRVLRITRSGGGGGIPGVVPTNPGSKNPKRLRATDVIRMQTANGCLRKRRVRVRLVRFSGVKFASAVVRVNGRKVRTVSGRALRQPIILRKLTGRRIRVKVALKTASGRTFSLTRRYRFCAGS